jgi:NADH-quinone oxidoreductase subunit C
MSDPATGPGGSPEDSPEESFPATDIDAAGTPVVDVAAGRWLDAAVHARDRLGMDFIDWLSAVDVPDGDPPGVDIVVHVVDSRSGRGHQPDQDAGPSGVRRLLLRTHVPDADPRLRSLTSVWPGVAWHERETYEMFGVRFEGFDDGSGDWLRPLLLPDGFEGTPLRKTFVLAARASKPWPGAKEPGESDAHMAPGRRKTLPPGVPDAAGWGPRAPGTEPATEPPERPPRPERAARPERTARPERAPRPERPARPERTGPPRRQAETEATEPPGPGRGDADA